MGRREIIVGDVHGMLDELLRLLDVIAVQSSDQLVFVGDLINKGPDTVGVVSLVRSLRAEGIDVVLLLGNHEERLLRTFRRTLSGAGGPVSPSHDKLIARIESLGTDNMQFLESAVLWHRLSDSGALAVHAGIPPALRALPLPEELSALSHRQQLHMQQMLRVRRVNADGNMIKLDHATESDPFWADVYDGRFGHVYFGHNAFPDEVSPRRFPHATGVDLGAVYGNRLAAMVLEPGEDTRTLSVAASRAFA